MEGEIFLGLKIRKSRGVTGDWRFDLSVIGYKTNENGQTVGDVVG